MARNQPRVYIPVEIRRDLWIAAGGRCEFRGCNKPVDRDFLTKKKQIVGEYAHIIADSPDGARGVPGVSEALAKEPKNLMLACRDCHGRIDHNGLNNEYTVAELQAMKRDHEARIEHIYSANGAKDSLPILMSFPVGAHVPIINIHDIHFAMLENSNYTCFPVNNYIHIDKADFDLIDEAPEFWPRADKIITDMYERRILPAITAKNGPSHLTIAAFAPIPLLMKLGVLIGDKTEATVLDLPGERWLWEKTTNFVAPQYTFDIPESLPTIVDVAISISNTVVQPLNKSLVEFRVISPNRTIIRTAEHAQDFRHHFNAFLMKLINAGARVLHLYPATPLCVSVEIGRLLLPKTFDEVYVWEWQSSVWKKSLRLK